MNRSIHYKTRLNDLGRNIMVTWSLRHNELRQDSQRSYARSPVQLKGSCSHLQRQLPWVLTSEPKNTYFIVYLHNSCYSFLSLTYTWVLTESSRFSLNTCTNSVSEFLLKDGTWSSIVTSRTTNSCPNKLKLNIVKKKMCTSNLVLIKKQIQYYPLNFKKKSYNWLVIQEIHI